MKTASEPAGAPAAASRLDGKDFINIGIFTALYFVVVFAVACLGFIPVLMVLICAIIPLVAGIPYMLFLTRVKKFGMIAAMGLLIGIIMFATGMGYFSIATGLVFGLLADLVARSGGYASTRRSILSHGVFSCWVIGNFLPMLITADSYYALLRVQYGDAYVNELMGYLQPWAYPLMLAAAFVTGVIGGWIGAKVLKKHFSRAGIA